MNDAAFQPWHMVLLLTALVLFYGPRRIPESFRALGKSIRSFVQEQREHLREELRSEEARRKAKKAESKKTEKEK